MNGTRFIVLPSSDFRFLEIKKEGLWLVKVIYKSIVFQLTTLVCCTKQMLVLPQQFYAPWCGYCKRLEPVFNHVAQALHDAEIRVGRVDCTRFPAVGKAFNIDGLPTIML